MNKTELIIKLLQLTQSPNDHEALSAIRKANQVLADLKLDWNGLVVAIAQAGRQPPRSPGTAVDPRVYQEFARQQAASAQQFAAAGLGQWQFPRQQQAPQPEPQRRAEFEARIAQILRAVGL